MSALLSLIISVVLISFTTYCGIKLYDMGSEFAYLLRRYGAIVAVLMAAGVLIFSLWPMIVPSVEAMSATAIAFAGAIAIGLMEHNFSVCRKALLEPRHYKKGRKQYVLPIGNGALALLNGIDMICGAMDGIALAVAFSLDVNLGIFLACAFGLMLIVQKMAVIDRYREAVISDGLLRVNLGLSILITPVMAVATFYYLQSMAHQLTVILGAVLIGYLCYLCVWHGYFIVKRLQNR